MFFWNVPNVSWSQICTFSCTNNHRRKVVQCFPWLQTIFLMHQHVTLSMTCTSTYVVLNGSINSRMLKNNDLFPNYHIYLKRCLVVQNLKMTWNKRFIPKLFVWHSSRDVFRNKWRYYQTGLYTEKKRSHWLKQWPIRKGLGDKKRRVVIGWKGNLDFVETLEQSTNGKLKRFRRSSRRKRILFVCREEDLLGPALANISVSHQEEKLSNVVNRPLAYFRYVDDTFAIFNNEDNCNAFLSHLNSLHPSLRFTHEKESNHSLPFLDVLVERHDSKFSTSVYRKPTFTGQYLRWNSFSPHKRKINFIGTLVHKAFMICSKGKLDPEPDKILSILLENG